jgi:hypothetical protein
MLLESVPVSVSVFDAVSVFPSAIVKVADVAGAVTATLLIDVAVATPMVGVVNVGEVANTNAPEPVSSLITPANCDEVVAANCDRLPLVKASPPPLIVCHVESPRRNLVEIDDPLPRKVGPTVPLVISEPE